MAETHPQRGSPLTHEDSHDLETEEPKPLADDSAPEFDHRGIQLPARSRVGGIITPQ
jgi:hypothetical protein